MEPTNGPYTSSQAFLALLVEVARADKKITPEERSLIQAHLSILAQDLGGAAILERLDSPQTEDDAQHRAHLQSIASSLSRYSLPAAVRDAFVLAASDGEISREELAVLKDFLVRAGIPEENFPLVIRWCESALDHMRQARYIFNLDRDATPE